MNVIPDEEVESFDEEIDQENGSFRTRILSDPLLTRTMTGLSFERPAFGKLAKKVINDEGLPSMYNPIMSNPSED